MAFIKETGFKQINCLKVRPVYPSNLPGYVLVIEQVPTSIEIFSGTINSKKHTIIKQKYSAHQVGIHK